jgi:hypothetical protein
MILGCSAGISSAALSVGLESLYSPCKKAGARLFLAAAWRMQTTRRSFRTREVLSAQCLQQTTPLDQLRRHPFRVLEPAWRYRSVEDILGAGNIQERIPQIDPRDHAASAIFLFHLQGRSSA